VKLLVTKGADLNAIDKVSIDKIVTEYLLVQ